MHKEKWIGILSCAAILWTIGYFTRGFTRKNTRTQTEEALRTIVEQSVQKSLSPGLYVKIFLLGVILLPIFIVVGVTIYAYLKTGQWFWPK